jgi:F0F1-type ATP synthase assembly protein I
MHETMPPRAAIRTGIAQMSGRSHSDGRGPSSGVPTGTELIGLGIAIAVSVVLPMLVGFGVDTLLHTSPLCVSIGLAVGIVAACVLVISRFRQYLT